MVLIGLCQIIRSGYIVIGAVCLKVYAIFIDNLIIVKQCFHFDAGYLLAVKQKVLSHDSSNRITPKETIGFIYTTRSHCQTQTRNINCMDCLGSIFD